LCDLCGNKAIDAGEGCDDGNYLIGDGCSEICQVEIGFTCIGSNCYPICGDGLIKKG